jgi:hypothetical protein
MFLAKRTSNWTRVNEVCSSWRFLGGITPDRLAILDAIWEKEIGLLGKHCQLLGVDGHYILVKPRSAMAASELALRSSVLVKGLNKYFKRPWIKGIRTDSKI